MALFGLVKDKIPAPVAGLRNALQQTAPAPQIPDDVDLSALWEDPNDKGSLPLILSGVAAVASSVALIKSFF